MAEPKQQPAAPVTQQPKALAGVPTMEEARATTGSEEWQSGIFECFEGEDLLCLKTTFCSCFTYGKTMHRSREPSMATYERINNDCLMFVAANCFSLGWFLTFLKRGELRESYNLKGDHVTDCLLSAFCGCCTLIQHEKEVIAKQRAAGLVSQGYQAPAGMTTGQ
ncbi:PLAC8 family protein [Glarea lozoyensis ATCC 20868]|uniref:PLAC8 family protein n=1 Tax=Glarea lozoyensis (strain ATCC 20868 / MF5171) TaxID=1116229 RepID=S3CRL3_GLAL2|nr:PLAC8 family protein [Glarea lozoyensis ATCC 20868]EPE27729.1 PLAC8 family protein [Glarea lozoyensis ATCC 20868]